MHEEEAQSASDGSPRKAFNLPQRGYQAVYEEGGFSYDLNGNVPTDGYMVAYEGTEWRLADRDFTPETLAIYVKAMKAKLAPGDYIGAWRAYDGTVCLDRSHNISDRRRALREARRRRQDAIYDVAAGEAISVDDLALVAA